MRTIIVYESMLTVESVLALGRSLLGRLSLSGFDGYTDRYSDARSEADTHRYSPAADKGADRNPNTCPEGRADARALACLFMFRLVEDHYSS
jgi:hypothetical protein